MRILALLFLVHGFFLLNADPSPFVVLNRTPQDFRLVFVRQSWLVREKERRVVINPDQKQPQKVEDLPCGTYDILLFRKPFDNTSRYLGQRIVRGNPPSTTSTFDNFESSCLWQNVSLTNVGFVLQIKYLPKEELPPPALGSYNCAFVHLISMPAKEVAEPTPEIFYASDGHQGELFYANDPELDWIRLGLKLYRKK